MRRPSRREWLLLACVPLLVLAALGAEGDGTDAAASVVDAAPAGTSRAGNRPAAAEDGLDIALPRRNANPGKPADVFTNKSWYVPPPPPPAPVTVAPAPPSAPPLPFTYLGRYTESGQSVFFLVRGARILTVRPGEVIDGSYRVEGIVGTVLGLTYLPLNIRQNLETGDAG